MKMTFRWYGSGSDQVSLKQIKQIPGMTGIMGFLDYKPAGDVWTEEEIKSYIDEAHAAGLECEVIESACPPGISTSKTTGSPSAIWPSTA